MARMIDADKINYHEHTECMGHGDFEMVRIVTDKEIAEIQTVDAVEVVRCRECKYYCQDEIYGEMCRHPELDFEIECYDHWINTKPDDFCSYGERKGGGSDG